MSQQIKVPEVSDGVTEGTVISISVAVDDRVEEDQTLLEMETDKAVVAIPSPFDGVITEINVSEGDTIQVGQAIMSGDPGGESASSGSAKEEKDQAEDKKEEKPEPDAEKEKEKEKEKKEKEKKEKEEPKQETKEAPQAPQKGESPTPPSDGTDEEVDLETVRTGDRVAPAAPSVRRLARELGVDIYQVQGTGPGERISEEDVRGFVRETMERITGGGSAPASTGEFPGLHAQRPLPDFTKWGGVTVEPLTRVREITADAMSYAWSTIPMVTQYDKADITELEAFRKQYNQKAEVKLTMTAILVKICAAALKAFPRFNSSLDLARKELILKQYVGIGVAVDTPGGLLVPVIRDADQKGIEKLAGELNETAEKTRERRVSPADMEGGTFTISNLGGIGGTAFTPIVYAPQVAILGVSRAEREQAWNGSEFQPRLRMPLSLTYDHRVIDGADGARFLRWICEAIEKPINLVMKG